MKLYRLIREVPNPLHDKRFRHGLQSLKSFPVGYSFVFDEEPKTSLDGMRWYHDGRSLDNRRLEHALCKAHLIPNALQDSPKNVQEYMYVMECELNHYYHDILDELWSQGPATQDVIKAALGRVIAEEQK